MSEDVSPASSTDWRRLEEQLEAIVTDSGVMFAPAPRAAMQMPSHGISVGWTAPDGINCARMRSV